MANRPKYPYLELADCFEKIVRWLCILFIEVNSSLTAYLNICTIANVLQAYINTTPYRSLHWKSTVIYCKF